MWGRMSGVGPTGVPPPPPLALWGDFGLVAPPPPHSPTQPHMAPFGHRPHPTDCAL